MVEIVNVRDDARGGRAEVRVYGEIGWETDANSFTSQLSDLEVDEITVRVHSPGGDAYDGIAIMSALKSHPAKVTAIIEGMAASAASFIAVGGADEVIMRPHAEIMIHDAMTVAMGNAEEMQRAIENLDRVSDNIAAVYAAKSGGAPESWREAMRKETWFTAEEAELAGLVDRVEDGSRAELAGVGNFKLTNKFRGRRGKPPVELLRGDNSGGYEMDELSKHIAVKLGLDANAFTADEVLQVIDALSENAEGVEAEAEPEKVEESDAERRVREAEEALAEARAALAGEGEGDEDEGADLEDEDADDEDDDASGGDGLETVTLDKATFEELKAAAEHGWQAKAQDDARSREAEVDKWIAEGRLNASRRAEIVSQMEKNADGVRAVIGNIPKGTIPRGEAGHGLDMNEHENDASVKSSLSEAADKAGLFRAPNL